MRVKLFAMLILSAGIMMATACNKEEEKEVVLPAVKTGDFTAQADGSCKGYGEVTSDGNDEAVSRGVVFGQLENPSIDENYKKIAAGTGVGKYDISLGKGSFAPGFTYHVRAYAQNSKGLVYGEDVEFTVPVK